MKERRLVPSFSLMHTGTATQVWDLIFDHLDDKRNDGFYCILSNLQAPKCEALIAKCYLKNTSRNIKKTSDDMDLTLCKIPDKDVNFIRCNVTLMLQRIDGNNYAMQSTAYDNNGQPTSGNSKKIVITESLNEVVIRPMGGMIEKTEFRFYNIHNSLTGA